MSRAAAHKWGLSIGFVATLLVASTAVAQPDARGARLGFDRGAELEAEAAALLKKGEKRAAASTLEKALEVYRSALADAPGDIDLTNRIGAILYYKKRCREALSVLRVSASKAYGIDTTKPETVNADRVAGDAKLRALLLLVGKCRLAGGPDDVGFAILERAGPLDVDVHFLLGRRYLEAKRNEPALRHLSAYIEHHPDDVKVRKAIANLQLRLDKVADAAASYRIVLRRRPDDLNALKDLAVIEVRRKRYRDAISIFERVLRQVPNDVPALFNLGVCLARTDRHSAAVTRFRQALKRKPTLSRGWYRLGLSLQATKRTREAERAFERAISQAPDYAPSYLALAKLHREARRTRACISVANKGLRRASDDLSLRLTLGHCQREAGRVREAVRTHRAALRRSPSSAEALDALGEDYFALSSFAEARDVLERAVSLEPTRDRRAALARALSALARRALSTKDIDEAITLLAKATELRPEDAIDLANLGLLLLSKGRLDEARDKLSRAVRADSSDLRVRVALARLQLSDAPAGALETLERRPGVARSAHALHVLGLAQLRLGRPQMAVPHLRAAVSLEPKDARLRFDLGRAQLRARDYAAAWETLGSIDDRRAPKTSSAALVFGYAAYRSGDFEQATVRLGALASKNRIVTKLTTAAWIHYGIRLVSGRKLSGAREAFQSARTVKRNVAAVANLAAVDYQSGKAKKAYRAWRRLSRRRPPAEVLYNIAIYFDDELGKERRAYTFYKMYAKRLPAGHRDDATALLVRKQQLFGFRP